MTAGPCVDVLQQFPPLVGEDAAHEYPVCASSVEVPIDESEGLGPMCDASHFGVVSWELPFHHPFQERNPLVGVLEIGLGSLSECHDLLGLRLGSTVVVADRGLA